MRRSCLLSACAFVLVLQISSLAQTSTTAAPKFSHSTRILNPYLPWSTLKKDVLLGTSSGQRNLVERTLTNLTRTFSVNGQPVKTIVVQDKDYVGGRLVEITRDYFAQSDDGTVYYLGEDVDDYENGRIVGHEGAWRYGVNTSHLGIIVPGNPRVGQTFQAENIPGIAVENDQIVLLSATVQTPIGTFNNAMKIVESYPDGHKEFKYYVPEIGVVSEIDPDGTIKIVLHSSEWTLSATAF